MEVTEKHGAIGRDAGNCVLATDLEAHRIEWKRAVRIILKVLTSSYGRCTVLSDDAEQPRLLSHQYTSDR